MEIKYFPISGNGANCYLVKTESAAIVIDPFEADGRVITFFKENGEKDKYILLTHCHFDHILGAKELREFFGGKIIIGKLDETGLANPDISLSNWVGLKQEPFSADITVADGDLLDLGGTEFKVLHTPGHTVGSVCYMAEDVIFSGDTLFAGSVGRTDFPTGNFATLNASLKKLKDLGKDYTLYPGHGEPTTLFREIKTNPYML
jgi:glyoxylase-like metal-dependent hydrolase (beta-lactamase superfamily II)